jgi:Tfp pilus assembly PilM family ATPase
VKGFFRAEETLTGCRLPDRFDSLTSMTKLLILDWQKDSILLTRGHWQGSQAVIDALAFESLGVAEAKGNGDDSDPDAVREQLTPKTAVRKAAAALHAKGDVIVLAARELLELRTVQIPKMETDDIPDVIRFQAQRQLTNMTDAWIVDYVLLPQVAGQEMQTALVAAISPVQLSEIEAACQSAGLQPERILLRPLEIARMATQSGRVSRSGISMAVCVNRAMADFLLIVDGQVVQVRSTRLPAETEHRPAILLGEIRRTLLAAADTLSGRELDCILLVASAATGNSIEQTLASAFKIPVNRFLPEALLPPQHQERAETEATRLAAVAGVLAPASDRSTVIDFKAPKRRPPPKKNTRTWILAAAAGVVLLLAGLAWYTTRLRQLNAEYAMYTSELISKQEVGKSAEAKIYELRTIEEFLQGSLNWLDEVTYMAQQMPPSSQVKLEAPTFTLTREGEGLITVTVKADNAASIAAFEDSLRSANHAVSGTGASQLTTPDGDYRWRGQSTIRIAGRGWSSPLDSSGQPAASSEQPATIEAEYENEDDVQVILETGAQAATESLEAWDSDADDFDSQYDDDRELDDDDDFETTEAEGTK